MPGKKKITALAAAKHKAILEKLEAFEKLVNSSSFILSDIIFDEFLTQLNIKDGEILSEEENVRRVNLIDKAWDKYKQQQGVRVVTSFVNDLTDIIALGSAYYSELIPNQTSSKEVLRIIDQQLGIKWVDGDWQPLRNGYVNALIEDATIRTRIKQIAYKNITSGTGYKTLVKELKEFIAGTGNSPGEYYKFYENYAFDTYSAVDRTNSMLHAERLGLTYFLYNGGVISDSREFCKERHGKVFTPQEAEAWRDLIGKYKLVPGKRKAQVKVPIGPIVEDKETYEPVRDLGGIKCRHSADFISEEIAKELLEKQ